MAQPSLTRAVKQLEEELGGELFRRERNLTHLTEFGLRMRPLLQQCFDSATAAKSLATSLRSGKIAPLAIGVSHAVNISILVPHLQELTRTFQGLELRFERGSPSMLAEHLKMGDIELVISGPLGETWERLESWPLFAEPYCLAMGKSHALAAKSTLRADDIRGERFLSRTYCESYGELSAFLQSCGLNPDMSHKVVSEPDLVALLGAGLGYALAPRSSIAGSDEVSARPLEGLTIGRTVSVYAASGRKRSAAATALMKALRATNWCAMADQAP